jgi:hypothetical protein
VDPIVDQFRDRLGTQTQTCETQAVDQPVDQVRDQIGLSHLLAQTCEGEAVDHVVGMFLDLCWTSTPYGSNFRDAGYESICGSVSGSVWDAATLEFRHVRRSLWIS